MGYMKEYLNHLMDLAKGAFSLAWDKLGILGTLFALSTPIIIKFLKTPKPITCEKMIGGNWKMSIQVFLGVVVVAYSIFFLVVSSKEYNEKVKKTKGLHAKIKRINKKLNKNIKSEINICWIQVSSATVII